VHLEVEPADGLIDEESRIRVTGLTTGTQVRLTVSVTDAAGHRWASVNRFLADGAGTVDVGRDAPRAGTYEGVDPTGPWWSMEFRSEDAAPVAFVAPSDELTFACSAAAEADGRVDVEVTRRWSSGGRRTEVPGDGFLGICFEPADRRAAGPAVLVVPGSTGAEAMTPLAGLLASHAYTAMVAAYMQEPGLPSTLREIPIERLLAALRALADRDDVATGRVAVVSASVGTEGALAALAYGDADVRAVVAIAPSSVIWQALPDRGQAPHASSWSYGGEPLPWVPMRGERILPEIVRHELVRRFSRRPRPTALHLFPAYAAGLRDGDAVARGLIPVERIRAPLLLLSGQDDQMWPASDMARQIIERRRQRGTGAGDAHLDLPDAGHFLRPPITPTTVPWNDALVAGGTGPGNARAQREGWAAVLQFLDSHLR
jgi:dienelactone hydrolase